MKERGSLDEAKRSMNNASSPTVAKQKNMNK